MEEIINDFVPVFNALMTVVRGILLPTAGQDAVSMMFWFWVVLAMISAVLVLFKSFGGKGRKA